MMMIIIVIVLMPGLAVSMALVGLRWLIALALKALLPPAGIAGRACFEFFSGILQHFIELAFIEPDAAALGAIVYFDVVSFGHQQGFIAMRTFHDPVRFWGE